VVVRTRSARIHRCLVAVAALLALVALGSACGGSSSASSDGRIVAVGAENEYADVMSQIGGKYVQVSAIMSNPNSDPHTFEASPGVAQTVGSAKLIVQNGLGYDDFMDKIESASPSNSRKVIDVQHLLGLPDSTPNPHLWYDPKTMPAVAKAVAARLSALQPGHAAYFKAREARFQQSMQPWLAALSQFSTRHPGTAVATTEPVADYMLEAAGIKNLTPFSMQADIMNDTDPPPQDISLQESLFSQHRVQVFVYNQQVTDTITQDFLNAAASAGVPVVGVYETMPPGYHYQSWMMAELNALQKAVTQKVSTEKLTG